MRHRKVVVIELPQWLGARGQARRLCAPVPGMADNCLVVVESRGESVPDDEFCDELVRVVLTERRAAQLVLHELPPRTVSLLTSAAARQGVAARVRER
ncbi:MAG: hypothetical protein IT198_09825 [Acidimicrobiia bacterium]|nr:hypothetical protein [Acidimicrobiia bacterium]